MNKLHNWATKLDSYFDECAKKEFEYGVFDCAIFVVDGVLAMTGADIFWEQRGKYKNEDEAKTLIRKIFPRAEHIPVQAVFDRIIDQFVELNKFKKVSKNFVPRGGIVLLDEMLSNSLGLVDLSGREIVCPHPEHGLLSVPLHHGYKFWSIE